MRRGGGQWPRPGADRSGTSPAIVLRVVAAGYESRSSRYSTGDDVPDVSTSLWKRAVRRGDVPARPPSPLSATGAVRRPSPSLFEESSAEPADDKTRLSGPSGSGSRAIWRGARDPAIMTQRRAIRTPARALPTNRRPIRTIRTAARSPIRTIRTAPCSPIQRPTGPSTRMPVPRRCWTPKRTRSVTGLESAGGRSGRDRRTRAPRGCRRRRAHRREGRPGSSAPFSSAGRVPVRTVRGASAGALLACRSREQPRPCLP